MLFQKARRVGTIVTSGDKMFHRTGATADKVLRLDPISGNSLANEIHNMSFLPNWVGQVDVTGKRQLLQWVTRHKGF